MKHLSQQEKDDDMWKPAVSKSSFCLALLIIAALTLAGCHHVTYVTDKPVVGEPQTGSHDYFFWGMAGSAFIEINKICPNGLAKIHLYKGFVDALLSSLTFGIWSPRSFEIWCAPTGPVVSPLPQPSDRGAK